ncbi:hypothetical protein JN531_014670 [Flagellatimonas centrodinii]|uniref:hypothetical protein n=1 Tax=Flagellatimonas centrodinii TaxID=2806210 RepID=UPI001FEDDB38|nr:hypothetical protein [Flagellatimonas centrodinii]ULQ46331.1 hypothetical protein JN531_014670 [Flagellatimonas centrodinii]
MDPLRSERRTDRQPAKKKPGHGGLWLSLLIPAVVLFGVLQWYRAQQPVDLPVPGHNGGGSPGGASGGSVGSIGAQGSPIIVGGVTPAPALEPAQVERFEPRPTEVPLAGARAVGGGDRLPEPAVSRELSAEGQDNPLCKSLQTQREAAEAQLEKQLPPSEARLFRNERDNAIQNLSRLGCFE